MSLNLASFAREKYESIVEANVSSTLCCPSTKKNSLSILPHTGNTNFIHAKIIFRSNSKNLPILNESTKTPKKKRRRTCNYPTYRNFPSPLFLLFILYYIYILSPLFISLLYLYRAEELHGNNEFLAETPFHLDEEPFETGRVVLISAVSAR